MNESHIESESFANNLRYALVFPSALVVFAVICFLAWSDFALPKPSIPTIAFLVNVSMFGIILTTLRYRKIKRLKKEGNLEENPVKMTVSKMSSTFIVSLFWFAVSIGNGILREWQISNLSMVFTVCVLLAAIISGGLLLKQQLRNKRGNVTAQQ